jgi:hypothetical protein
MFSVSIEIDASDIKFEGLQALDARRALGLDADKSTLYLRGLRVFLREGSKALLASRPERTATAVVTEEFARRFPAVFQTKAFHSIKVPARDLVGLLVSTDVVRLDKDHPSEPEVEIRLTQQRIVAIWEALLNPELKGKPIVHVVCRGGAVLAVYSELDFKVEVLDWDDVADDPKARSEANHKFDEEIEPLPQRY